MSATTRLFVSSVPAAGITVAAVVFMQYLISGTTMASSGPSEATSIRFHAIDVKPDPPAPRDRELPPKPPPQVRPASQPRPEASPSQTRVTVPVDINMPTLTPSLGTGDLIGCSCAGFGGGYEDGDGEVIAKARIQPRYPPEAAREGIEGFVIVAFTVTAEGTVIDPQVIEANPRRVFDDEAIRAVLKWKFAPRIVDGRAVPSRVQQTLEFKLDG